MYMENRQNWIAQAAGAAADTRGRKAGSARERWVQTLRRAFTSAGNSSMKCAVSGRPVQLRFD